MDSTGLFDVEVWSLSVVTAFLPLKTAMPFPISSTALFSSNTGVSGSVSAVKSIVLLVSNLSGDEVTSVVTGVLVEGVVLGGGGGGGEGDFCFSRF